MLSRFFVIACGLVLAANALADTVVIQNQQTRTADYAQNATTSVPSFWATPGNSRVSDDQRATGTLVFVSMTGDGRIDLLRHEDFGFTIPSGATIDGIEIIAERQAGSAGVTGRVVLRRNVVPLETTRVETGTWPVGTDAEFTFGSSSDLWGTTWTPAIINASDFGLYYTGRSTAGGQSVSVDSLRIRVYYSEEVPLNAMPLAGSAALGVLVACIAIASALVLRRSTAGSLRF